MNELRKLIAKFKSETLINDEDLSKKLSITIDQLTEIESGKKELNEEEITRIKTILNQNSGKSSSGKRAVKILDLIFRFMATIMPLVVVILSIYGYKKMNVLIALLAVGVTCLSMTTLPKNVK